MLALRAVVDEPAGRIEPVIRVDPGSGLLAAAGTEEMPLEREDQTGEAVARYQFIEVLGDQE
jgi:hypothetical protein